MARLTYLTAEDLDPTDHDLISSGFNLQRAMVHSPRGARALARVGDYVRRKSSLDPRLRELAILQVGYSSACGYEFAHHVKIANGVGVSDADVRAIALESRGNKSHLSAVDRAALSLTRDIVAGGEINEADFSLLEHEIGAECLVDLVNAACLYCGVIRILRVFDIEIEDDFAHYLTDFPFARRTN